MPVLVAATMIFTTLTGTVTDVSFRYVLYLTSGKEVRSGLIADTHYAEISAKLIDFLKHSSGCWAVKVIEHEGSEVEVLVAREQVTHITMLKNLV